LWSRHIREEAEAVPSEEKEHHELLDKSDGFVVTPYHHDNYKVLSHDNERLAINTERNASGHREGSSLHEVSSFQVVSS